ncbi:MAG: hydroxymethylglutaryl-CoA reductase, degradative [Legionellales bacterium]|nr:hydroxymethylglutaryl-CoA reductase, degradative [Legionellales bacterium]|tara:strand:+ start:132 stop:1433 length:1302 start_codon:yes stop_codon:yes gene_type:complete
MSSADLHSGFHRRSRLERLAHLLQLNLIDQNEYTILLQAVEESYCEQADQLIENVIGCFPMPFAIVPSAVIDQTELSVPMVVEETSIVAALNRVSKQVRTFGQLTTQQKGHVSIGQLYMPHVKALERLTQQLTLHEDQLLNELNQVVLKGLSKRGGGAKKLIVRVLEPSKTGQLRAVIHLHCDVCDAMGANLINMALEYLKPKVEILTSESISTCIVSNLSDTQLTRATLRLEGLSESVRSAILTTAEFAEIDPYRATTHNKGIMNAIDAVLIATGNDWRAVEAGMHAYAARDGQYRSLTQWYHEGDTLVGILEAPIAVGIVGGMTTTHPMAQIALKLLKVNSAQKLARIIAAVGLMQNFAAIQTLSTTGIVQGHMSLHLSNLMMAAGVEGHERSTIEAQLKTTLSTTGKVTLSDVQTILSTLRSDSSESDSK